ncbi:hypothetical protein [Sandaracinus amylolyticus]|uniref:Uncharacterized protein n=1 Tax=Sandaracinus amylolyticus TaxID=927083 RepID=A0A0F6YLR1_9BACT|nr:hypothetical protein [Sandaracinus amylolyticus]AKF09478.1 hypothetical protein DB32_006627 [Sandaracinus amylolyticus]
MTRSFAARDLISLPPLTAEDAFALASQLTTEARAARAPAVLSEHVEALDASRGLLSAQLVSRRAGPGVDLQAAVVADRALDHAWGLVRDWLGAFHGLGDDAPRASEIAELHRFLFGEGLGFLTFKYHAEWTASQLRVDALRARRNEELVRALGGGLFLDRLLAAHARYGEVLGITASAPVANDTKVREALDGVLDAIREYVVAVVSTVRRDRPATAERADRLLRPVREWESTPRPAATSVAPPADPAAT